MFDDLRLENSGVCDHHNMRFSMKSVNSNLHTGSDLRQLASTCSDCKSWQKCCSIFSLYEHTHREHDILTHYVSSPEGHFET